PCPSSLSVLDALPIFRRLWSSWHERRGRHSADPHRIGQEARCREGTHPHLAARSRDRAPADQSYTDGQSIIRSIDQFLRFRSSIDRKSTRLNSSHVKI